MEPFHLDERFETGLQDIDRQHNHLVDLVNELGTRIVDNGVELDGLEELFQELTAYAHYHFKEEERLMSLYGVDQRHVGPHISAHSGFLAEVTSMKAVISPGSPDDLKQLLSFLIHWLVYHILGQDQNMAVQIRYIESGMTPDEAFAAAENAHDAVSEPLIDAIGELFMLVSARNRELYHLNQTLEAKVKQRTSELSKVNAQLEEMALTDILTGLPNRRHAMHQLSKLWKESLESGAPLICIMIDADCFKEINDTWGHDAGDKVLQEIAKTLRHSMRNDDIVCRLGGDEFFVICPNTDLGNGIRIAEQARERISELRVPTGDSEWQGSISVGVAARSNKMIDPKNLVKYADEGVYAAKQAGRNCVCSANLKGLELVG